MCCSSSVRVLFSEYIHRPHGLIQLSRKVHIVLRRSTWVRSQQPSDEQYPRRVSTRPRRGSCRLRINEVRSLLQVNVVSTPQSTQILFVVQANERNIFDQKDLEYELLEQCVDDVTPSPSSNSTLSPSLVTLSMLSAKPSTSWSNQPRSTGLQGC